MKRLVCIIPQIRHSSQTYESFKKNVLDTLEADLLLCIGGKDEDNEYVQNAKYVFKRSEPKNDWSEFFDEMSSEWRKFSHIPGGWLGPCKIPHEHKYTGGIVLFYRWYLFTILRDNKLLDTYDQIIVTRSDYIWVNPHPVLDCNHVWIPNGEFHGGLCDRHIVFPSHMAERVLAIGGTISHEQYEPMIQFYNSRKNIPWMYNIESYLFFRYAHDNLLEKIAFFPQRMYLINADCSVKYPGEYDDCQKNEDFVIWPWYIDFTFGLSRYGMFTGKAFRIPSSSDVSSNDGPCDATL